MFWYVECIKKLKKPNLSEEEGIGKRSGREGMKTKMNRAPWVLVQYVLSYLEWVEVSWEKGKEWKSKVKWRGGKK